MKITLIFLFLLVAGCGTSPTGYIPSEKSDSVGYSDKTIDQNLMVSTFKGSSTTKKETAELYAKLRAIEVCKASGKPNTHILHIKDKTYTKQETQVSSLTPSYYYGMSPYYGHYSGVGVAYMPPASATYSNQEYTYPLFEVYFECVYKPVDARVSLTNLSQSQVQSLVKDVKGGVQIDKVLSDSPNKGKLQSGDIIIKANNNRVEKVLEVYQASRETTPPKLNIEFFRNGVRKKAEVRFKDVSQLVSEAQNEILKTACKDEEIKSKHTVCESVDN